MANANKVILIGNLTQDPEIRRTPRGTAVADLRMATSRQFSTDDGDTEEVTFVDVTVWDRTAENAERYLRKGSPIYVEGRLKLDQWEDKQTRQPRSKLVVVGERLQFLSTGDKRTETDGNREAGAGGFSADRRGDRNSRSTGSNNGYSRDGSSGQRSRGRSRATANA